MRTDVRTVPPAEDVGHVGDVPVRRRWVQDTRYKIALFFNT